MSTFGAPLLCPHRTDFAESSTAEGSQTMMMDRRTFPAAMVAGAAASLMPTHTIART
ncbi:MAG TPA: hypothetical protein VGM32_20340 [Rhodopila sp.]|jgi:hypothetical protein